MIGGMMLTRPHDASPHDDTVITYRYTSPQFAQDVASLARLQRRDRRTAALRSFLQELGLRLLVVAILPPVAAALAFALTGGIH
jgi:hypothetical protein